MTLEHLQNLARIGELKQEPPDQKEFDGMLNLGKRRLQDAQISDLSEEGRFLSAYGAAHALALATLRWHGYRSDSRYLVFQCLQHTIGFSQEKWRILDQCHRKRNLAEYEGNLEITDQLLKELITTTHELLEKVNALGPVKTH
jgi:hypothetical protein